MVFPKSGVHFSPKVQILRNIFPSKQIFFHNLPDETVSIGAAAALPGPLSVLPRTTEPNVIVTHGDWRLIRELLLKQDTFLNNVTSSEASQGVARG